MNDRQNGLLYARGDQGPAAPFGKTGEGTDARQKAKQARLTRKIHGSASYEFPTAAPETVRAEFVGVSAKKAASRLLDALRKAHPGRRPSSIVIVLDWGADA